MRDIINKLESIQKLDESVLTEKKKKPKPTSPEKWARAKAKARSKFDVYPSAYANAYASKEYKKMGGGWRMGESEEQLDELKCWPGYTRVKGVPAGKPGSCKKKTKEDVDEASSPAQQAAIAIAMKKAGKTPKKESAIMKGIQNEGK